MCRSVETHQQSPTYGSGVFQRLIYIFLAPLLEHSLISPPGAESRTSRIPALAATQAVEERVSHNTYQRESNWEPRRNPRERGWREKRDGEETQEAACKDGGWYLWDLQSALGFSGFPLATGHLSASSSICKILARKVHTQSPLNPLHLTGHPAHAP